MKNAEHPEEVIKTIARKYLSDAEVVLFGSRARLDFHRESDYDILIITGKELTPKQKLPYKTRIRKELLTFDIRSDILIQSKKEIQKKKKLPGHIIKTILDEAIQI